MVYMMEGIREITQEFMKNFLHENMISPFVVGRKSFLFCITETGAEVSAFLYSLVESCKAMDINVEDYLTWLFLNGNRVKDGDRNGWRPWSEETTAVTAYQLLGEYGL